MEILSFIIFKHFTRLKNTETRGKCCIYIQLKDIKLLIYFYFLCSLVSTTFSIKIFGDLDNYCFVVSSFVHAMARHDIKCMCVRVGKKIFYFFLQLKPWKIVPWDNHDSFVQLKKYRVNTVQQKKLDSVIAQNVSLFRYKVNPPLSAVSVISYINNY